MVIRKANEEDLSEILNLYSHPEIDNGCVLNLKNAKQIFQKIKSYPDYHIYLAEINNEIVGTFALAIMDNIAHMGAKSGLIEDVVVSQNFQRQGIGKKMMEFAMKLCKEKNCYKVSLSSQLKRENSHKFYESIGFKIHGYSFLMELK